MGVHSHIVETYKRANIGSTWHLQAIKQLYVTKLKLYIEFHGVNSLGSPQIDLAREVLKLTYHRVS